MVDIETLGTRPGSVILSIGACVFNEKGTGNFARFYRNINVLSSLLAGLTVDEETVDWWRKQSDEARGSLFPGSANLYPALTDFATFIDKNDYVWAKGPDFDLVMIHEAYRAIGARIPWSFRNARDVRTMLWLGEALGIKYEPVDRSVAHNALHDALYQAHQVSTVMKKIWQL